MPNTATALNSIHQIAIRVRDVERAVTTYRDKLGMRFLFQAPPALAFFDCGGVRLMLTTVEEGEFDHPASLLYFRVDDIHVAYADMKERGVHFRTAPHPIADLGDRIVWLSDFEDGEDNVLALMSEVPKETDGAS